MSIKFVDDIVEEIKERGPIAVPKGCITGEAYEEWLYGKEKPQNRTRGVKKNEDLAKSRD